MRLSPAILLILLLPLGGCKPTIKGDVPTEFEPAVFTGISELPPLSDWSHWRGPRADGVSSEEDVPTKWSSDQNIVWKTTVPGRGHSSPIVHDDQVLLTTADESKGEQLLLSFERESGDPLWQKVIHRQQFSRAHNKNSHASATPACNGERIFCAFVNVNGLFVTATDLQGEILWQKKVGDFGSEHGYGSSPVLYESLVIVNGDNLDGGFVAALDVGSGELKWKTNRPTTGKHGSYGTPLVTAVAGRVQVIVAGVHSTTSYNPLTGKQLWTCNGPAEVTGCTPAASDQFVFSSGGFPEKELLAIRADGEGDISNSHVVWRARRGVTYVPSPVYYQGRLYVIDDDGVASCFEGTSGDVVWQKRLSGNFSSSPVIAAGHLFITSESGDTYVLKTGKEYKVVAKNSLPGGVLATPAISGGRLYLRTESALYCIGS